MKITLSTPSTISSEVSVTSAIQVCGFIIQSIMVCPVPSSTQPPSGGTDARARDADAGERTSWDSPEGGGRRLHQWRNVSYRLDTVRRAMTEPPVIAVIIPTCRRPGPLAACPGAVLASDFPRHRFEVVVVDDGAESPSGPTDPLVTGDAGVRWVRLPENRGPAAARNEGARVARGAYLAFIDDECVVDRDWLSRLESPWGASPDAAIGGRVLGDRGRKLYCAADQAILDVVYAYDNARPNRATFVGTALLAVPTEAFRDMGAFDPDFRTSEDRDNQTGRRVLSHRVLDAIGRQLLAVGREQRHRGVPRSDFERLVQPLVEQRLAPRPQGQGQQVRPDLAQRLFEQIQVDRPTRPCQLPDARRTHGALELADAGELDLHVQRPARGFEPTMRQVEPGRHQVQPGRRRHAAHHHRHRVEGEPVLPPNQRVPRDARRLPEILPPLPSSHGLSLPAAAGEGRLDASSPT